MLLVTPHGSSASNNEKKEIRAFPPIGVAIDGSRIFLVYYSTTFEVSKSMLNKSSGVLDCAHTYTNTHLN